MIIAHATTIAKTQANWSGGYLLVMLMALFNAQGRLAGGALSDRIGRMNTLRLIFLVQAGNMLFFRTYVTPLHLALGFAVAGFCYGAMFGIIPATTSDLFGLKYFGANYGILFTAWGLSGVIGPMSAARIWTPRELIIPPTYFCSGAAGSLHRPHIHFPHKEKHKAVKNLNASP